ncbi:MAG: hypothetical protein E6R03_04025 [Hyphomicrobiaceae bacterium]|nr:MAG: hypothetical protein E6R03_04025 [Hyphomicrobiaceae bacterium]
MAPQFDPPSLEDAVRFLDLFTDSGEDQCFQYFDDTKKTGDAGHFYAQIEDAFDALCNHNRLRRGVYFMVNRGDGEGRSAVNVTRVRAVFADLDGAPLQPILDCELTPNVIVESSPGKYQVYWLVSDCEVERFRSIQHAIAIRFGSDASIKDVSRVMRVPGFYHCKGTPFKVRIHSQDRLAPYLIEEVIAGLRLDESASVTKLSEPLPNLGSLQPKSIQPGDRHETLMKFAYRYACENETREKILLNISGINALYCSEPKPLEEIIAIVDSAIAKVPRVDMEEFLEKHRKEECDEFSASPSYTEDDHVFESENEDESGIKSAFALPESLLISAPGLTGEIANWIMLTSFYWQPSYALAASLAFVGMLKGHRVSTAEGARTNLITIAVGASSSAKTVPLKRLNMLARLAGLSHRICGEPASQQGMIKGLVEAGHKCFLGWDEIGLAFKEMFARNAPSYRSGIIRLILKLYSMADETVPGFQYANNDGKSPRVDLIQPCLCLFGTSTQDGIFSAFSSVEAVNGFAARLLIFETHDYLAERQPIGRIEPEAELVEKVRRLASEETAAVGNLTTVGEPPVPTIIPFSAEARVLFRDASRRFESLKREAIIGRKLAEESIWGRAYEQSTKVALTVEDGAEISVESAEWSIALVTKLCENMIVATREQIADNQTHAELNQILNIIKSAGRKRWVSMEDIYRKTRGLERRKRREHLANLIEEGTIETKVEETKGRNKQLFRIVNC